MNHIIKPCGISTLNSDKNNMKKNNLKLPFLLLFIAFTTLTFSSLGQDDNKCTKDCVTISVWKNCSEYCTGAKCVAFTNHQSYKVLIHYSWKSSNDNQTFKGDAYVESGETSDEYLLCPYKEGSFSWNYERAN